LQERPAQEEEDEQSHPRQAKEGFQVLELPQEQSGHEQTWAHQLNQAAWQQCFWLVTLNDIEQ
jgi:hypothetical protein